jgi:hypothetical protein
VTLRERLGVDAFEKLNQAFMAGVQKAEEAQKRPSKSKDKDHSDSVNSDTKQQGKLILDASVAPQDIKFPTDLDLLNDSREHTERIIDELWEPGPEKRKPRTYRMIARKEYLSVVKHVLKAKSQAKNILPSDFYY